MLTYCLKWSISAHRFGTGASISNGNRAVHQRSYSHIMRYNNDCQAEFDIILYTKLWQQVASALLPDMPNRESLIANTLCLAQTGEIISIYNTFARTGNIQATEYIEQCGFA